MIAFTAPLWLWTGEGGRWHFVTVPEAQSAEIKAHALTGPRAFGSVRVQATIGAVAWATSVFPTREGAYILPIKAEVRRKAGLNEGEQVQITLNLVD